MDRTTKTTGTTGARGENYQLSTGTTGGEEPPAQQDHNNHRVHSRGRGTIPCGVGGVATMYLSIHLYFLHMYICIASKATDASAESMYSC